MRAARYARHASNLLELTEHTYYTAQAHQLLAHIELDRQQPRDALDLLEKGLELLAEAGSPIDVALFRLEEARALIQLDRPEEAASIAMEATAELADGSPYDAGRSYCSSPTSSWSSATLGRRTSSTSSRRKCSTEPQPLPDRDLREARRSARGRRSEGRGAQRPEEGRRRPVRAIPVDLRRKSEGSRLEGSARPFQYPYREENCDQRHRFLL